MPEQEHTLPSGLSGIIAPWKTGDLAVFTDRRLARMPGPTFEAELAKRSWRSTTELGPYTFDGRPTWMRDVLQGDLFDVTRMARILTWGAMYPTDFQCRGKFCEHKIEVDVNLADMKIKHLSEEAAQMFVNGNRFPFTVPDCGTEILYSLPTGASAVRADKLAKQHGRHIHVMLAARLVSVQGVESPGRFVDWMANLSASDGIAVEEEMDRLNPGVDTSVDVICEECGLAQSHDVPFGPSFFTPERRKKKTSSD